MSKSPKHRKRTKSSGKRRPDSQKTTGLSGEEVQLWSFVTRTASPLDGKETRRVLQGGDRANDDQDFADLMDMGAEQVSRRPGSKRQIPTGQLSPARSQDHNGLSNIGRGVTGMENGAAGNNATGHYSNAGKPSRSPPSTGPAHIDKRRARKIARGLIEIDARIDLHGMRQREAHSALRRFVFNAHAKGYRIVLVITGKGGGFRKDTDDIDRDEHWSVGYDFNDEPGVLRRKVPEWIKEGDLGSVVAAYTNAHVRHGGDGALYIHLRKRKTFRPNS